MGPTPYNENLHQNHQIDMFKSYLSLTWTPSTVVKIASAIFRGNEEGYMVVILIKNDYKKR